MRTPKFRLFGWASFCVVSWFLLLSTVLDKGNGERISLPYHDSSWYLCLFWREIGEHVYRLVLVVVGGCRTCLG